MNQARLTRLRELAAMLVVCLGAAVFVYFASNNMYGRSSHRAETAAMQVAILHGEPYRLDGQLIYLPPNQNRILFPAVTTLLAGAMPLDAAFVAARFLSGLALAVTVWIVLRRTRNLPPEAAAIGVWLTALALPLTFTYPYEQTSDLLDGLLFAALAGAAWRNRRGWFVAIALLSTANRESAAFAGILWMTFHGVSASWRVHWREVAFSAAISVGAYAVVLLIRYVLGGARAVGAGAQTLTGVPVLAESLLAFVRHPQPTAWPALLFAALGPVLLWLHTLRQWLDPTLRRTLLAALLIAAASLLFGIPSELRIFIPSWVLVAMVAAAAYGRRLKAET